ncbi:rlmJ, partial [Symbiodinium microadriaticum]
ARRLGDNLVETARQTSQAAQRKAKGAMKEAGDVVKETVKELDETVPQPQLYRLSMTTRRVVEVGRILAEHKAEELIHHKPPPPRRFRPWLVGTLGFAAVLAVVATRRWAARRRGPSMAGTRRARRNTPTIPPIIPSREGVLQRTPSQSALTPVKVHKVEFQRVGLSDGAEWDSSDEQDAESPQDTQRQVSFGKMNPNTEYFQIGGQQDSPGPSPRPGNDRAVGA